MRSIQVSGRRSSRRIRVFVAVAAAVALVGACGGNDTDAADPSAPTITTPTTPTTTGATGGPTSVGFQPVAIDHHYGSTEISEPPQRIVSLDPQWTDVLLALDVVPVGYITHQLQEVENFPWQGNLLSDAEPVIYSDAIPYEAIAALHPDLILTTYLATDKSIYDTLTQIAPTVASPTDAEVQSWQTLTTTTGAVLGRQDDARQLIDDVDAQVDAIADQLPGIEGRTIAFANYVPGGDIVVLADPDDGANVLFTQLGLDLAPGIAAEGVGATGRVEMSPEQIGLLDGDVLAVLTNGASVDDIAGWDNLPAVETGAVVLLDQISATALNTPTPLSIGYGLGVLRPALEIAANRP